MAQPALDFFKKRNLLAKAETVEGTDSSPVVGTNGFMIFDGNSSTEVDKIERPIDKAHFGSDPFLVANRRARIEGDIELYAPDTPGTDSAAASVLLLPAGLAEVKTPLANTTAYNPVSTGIPSITAYWYHTGTLIKALGARVDISALSIAIGERMKARVSIMGSYTEVTAATPGTVVLPTKVPVVATSLNTRCKLTTAAKAAAGGSGALAALICWAKSLSVDLGNQLQHKEYSSKAVNGISDRQAKWTLRLAKTDIGADFDPWYVRDTGLILEVAMTLFEKDEVNGASDPATSLYSTLAIRGQVETVTPTDIDGDYGWELSGPCVPSSAGGDELALIFGDNTPP